MTGDLAFGQTKFMGVCRQGKLVQSYVHCSEFCPVDSDTHLSWPS